MTYLPQVRALRRNILSKFETRIAILGDDSGVIDVAGTTNKVYVRYPEGTDANGNTVYSQPHIVNAGVFGGYIARANVGVRVGLDDYGELEIKRSDSRDLENQGISARVTNPLRPETKFVNISQISLFQSRPVGSASDPATTVNVQPLRYDHYHIDNKWRGTEIDTDKINLSSYIPASGYHRVVVLFLQTFDNTIQVTASTAQTIDNAIDTTDFAECFAQRTAETMPTMSYYLADGATTIDSNALAIDFRQFINVPPIVGYQNPVVYAERLRLGRDTITQGTLTAVTGTYNVYGTLWNN